MKNKEFLKQLQLKLYSDDIRIKELEAEVLRLTTIIKNNKDKKKLT